jgi:hypothetical protein
MSVVSLTCEKGLFCYWVSGVARTLGDGASKDQPKGAVGPDMGFVFHTSSRVAARAAVSSQQRGVQSLFSALNLAWHLQIAA